MSSSFVPTITLGQDQLHNLAMEFMLILTNEILILTGHNTSDMSHLLLDQGQLDDEYGQGVLANLNKIIIHTSHNTMSDMSSLLLDQVQLEHGQGVLLI